MGLFKKAHTSVVLLDIRSSSIGAAYVLLTPDAPPTMVHSVRIPIDPHATEPLVEAFPRTLERVLDLLVKEGAPELRKVSGSGKTDKVFVTFTAPWQHSRVFSRSIERDKPFLFTRQSLSEATPKPEIDTKGKIRVSEMSIATLLNGYEVANPFGKRIKRAEIIMLSSSIEEESMHMVSKQIRSSLHHQDVIFAAFMPETYTILRDLYPHQRDYIVMDIGNETTDVLLAKHGLLISLSCMPHGVGEMVRAARGVGLSSPRVPHAEDSALSVDMTRATPTATSIGGAETVWLSQMRDSLAALATQEPLPRTIFLLAEENVRDFLRQLLDAPELRSLWLSDESLTIVPVLPSQFKSFLGNASVEEMDPILALLALAAAKRFT